MCTADMNAHMWGAVRRGPCSYVFEHEFGRSVLAEGAVPFSNGLALEHGLG